MPIELCPSVNFTLKFPKLSVVSTQFGSSNTLQLATLSLNVKPDGISVIFTFLAANIFFALSVNFPLTVTSLLSVSISSSRKVGPPILDDEGEDEEIPDEKLESEEEIEFDWEELLGVNDDYEYPKTWEKKDGKLFK